MDLRDSYNKLFERRKHVLILTPVFATSLFFLVTVWAMVAVHFSNPARNIILHFDFYKGIDLVGDVPVLYEALILASVIYILNLALSLVLFKKVRFLSYVLALAAPFFSILIFIAMRVIISVN